MVVVVEVENEVCNSNSIYKIYTIWIQKAVASMKKSVRPVFSLLLVFVVAATLGCRVVIQNGVGSGSGSIFDEDHIWGFGSGPLSLKDGPPLDFALFNSTLIKLAEVDDGEVKLQQEIKRLLVDDLVNSPKFRTFASWRRFFTSSDLRVRTSKGTLVNHRGSPGFSRVRSEFRRVLSDWHRKKRFQPHVLDELVEVVKVPIDRYNNRNSLVMDVNKRKYSTCAVVGNSGILLTKEFGKLIDDHEVVIRLNNARIDSYKKNVGSKTSISFVNSNILHLCARREDCFCHPYGVNVPILMYMCQPTQFLDYVVCGPSHKAPLIVTDPKFDVLCARIVKYYSLKRFADGSKNKTLEQWNSAHEGSYFHYSSGMQSVMLALGICDEVSLFGFGKSTNAKHHYHTNQKAELGLHDYMAEYDFYSDLTQRPRAIPFISRGFKFPPVKIYQ